MKRLEFISENGVKQTYSLGKTIEYYFFVMFCALLLNEEEDSELGNELGIVSFLALTFYLQDILAKYKADWYMQTNLNRGF